MCRIFSPDVVWSGSTHYLRIFQPFLVRPLFESSSPYFELKVWNIIAFIFTVFAVCNFVLVATLVLAAELVLAAALVLVTALVLVAALFVRVAIIVVSYILVVNFLLPVRTEYGQSP